MKKALCFCIFFVLGFSIHSLHPAAQKIYTTAPVNPAVPQIDGLINEPVWKHVEWSGDFTQIEPDDGAQPSEKTEFKILYDDKNLYVAIHAWDSSEISQRATRRDGDLVADAIGILLDSYHDKRTSFELYVTAAGVKHDRITSNNNRDDGNSNWDPIWHVKTSHDNDGWTAEMQIPLSQIRFGNNPEMIWGLQVARYIHRKQEWSYWQYIPQDAPGWMSFYGELHGLKGIEASHRIELLPYVVTGYETFKKEIGNPFMTGRDHRMDGGLDGKMGVSSNFTIDFTLNPDFGQVEADPSEVNLSAFESYYDERRPFFIEGQNILESELPGSSDMENTLLFYSRRIGRYPNYSPRLSSSEFSDIPDQTSILGAAKLTGRTDSGLSIGILNAVTAKENAEIASGQSQNRSMTVEPATNYFVGRLQKEFNEGETIIGGTATAVNRDINDEHLQFLNKAAYTGGFNIGHQWNDRTWYANLYTAFSMIRGSREAIRLAQTASTRYFQRPDAPHLSFDPNRTSLSGHGGSFSIGRGGNSHWRYNLRLNWRSPGFELNDVGFLRHADLVQEKLWMKYQFFNPVGIFRRLSFASEQLARWNFNGDHLFNEGYVQAEGQFTNYWEFYVRAYLRAKELSPTALRGGPAIKVESSHNFNYELSTDARQAFSFSLGGGSFWRHDGFSNNHSFGLGASWRPSDVLSLSFEPSYYTNKTDLHWITAIDDLADTRYIFGRVKYNEVRFVFRLNYSMTPNFTIQYYGQPFIGAGQFSRFTKITNPQADKYEDRFHVFTESEISKNGSRYDVNENASNVYEYGFNDPDFNQKEFRSNLVVRWEYHPGSTLYLVWTQDRAGSEAVGDFAFSDNMNALFDVHPNNIFLVKASHWFSF